MTDWLTDWVHKNKKRDEEFQQTNHAAVLAVAVGVKVDVDVGVGVGVKGVKTEQQP